MGNQKTAPFFLMGSLKTKKGRLKGARWAQQKFSENLPLTHKNCKNPAHRKKMGGFCLSKKTKQKGGKWARCKAPHFFLRGVLNKKKEGISLFFENRFLAPFFLYSLPPPHYVIFCWPTPPPPWDYVICWWPHSNHTLWTISETWLLPLFHNCMIALLKRRGLNTSFFKQ